jgi:hypothetical protein
MKLEVSSFDYKKSLSNLLSLIIKNRIIFTSILLLLVGGFALERMIKLTVAEIDDSYKEKRLSEINRVDFDQDSIDAIYKLNESRINISSDINTDRDNPFKDN